MADQTELNRMVVAGIGAVLGLFFGGFCLITTRLLLPRFFESWLEVAGLAAISMLLGGLLTLAANYLSRRRATGSVAGILTAITVLWLGKVLFPSALASLILVAAVLGIAAGWVVGRLERLPVQGIAFTGLLLVLVSALLTGLAHRGSPIDMRLLVIGLDAGTWTILDELIAEGDLPNIQAIVEGGASGILLSEEPTLSPRVWTTIATGKRPDKHGVEDFFSTQNRDLKAARFWEIANEFDLTVGLFRWLVTWPPEPVGPFNVPGWMARDDSTIPPRLSFIKQVERKFQNDIEASLGLSEAASWGAMYLRSGVRWTTCLKIARLAWRYWTGPRAWEAGYATKRTMHDLLNMDVFLSLMQEDRPDLAAVVLYGSDNLAHKIWKYRYPEDFGLDPETRVLGEFLDNYYREADRFIGELMDLVSNNTTLMILSDHGYSSEEHAQGHDHQKVFKPRMVHLLEYLELESPTEATVASVSTRGYITFQGEADVREERLESAKDRLGSVLVEGTAHGIFLLTRMESGQLEVAIADHLDLEEDTPIETSAGAMKLSDLVEVEERGGGHSLEGILLARGPSIRAGIRLPEAHLEDVTPTMLYLLGIPVARDMDGRILEEMLKAHFLERNSLELVTSYDELILQRRQEGWEEGEDETLIKELEALGYLN